MAISRRHSTVCRRLATALLVWALCGTLVWPAWAVTITEVVHGQVEVRAPRTQVDGKVLTEIVQASQRAIVHASDFNIAPNHVVNIMQPVGGWMLSRVFGPATQIEGALNATGSFILLNPNGVFIGPNGQVNVGGMFAASTLNLSNANFLNGLYLFQDSGTNGAVRNAGSLKAGVEGLYLFAPTVENQATGIITSANGHVTLGAGKTAFLSHRPDGKGFLSEVTAPADQAINLGSLVADGGQVTMAGRVVNQSGIAKADSVVQRNGRIELVASEQVNLTAGSQTLSRGSVAGAHGGTVIAKAATRDQNGNRTGGSVSIAPGATIDVTPGAGGLAGEVWLGGTTVTQTGTVTGAVHRLIPSTTVLSDAELLALQPGVARQEINVLAMDDIDVSTSVPLDSLGLTAGQVAMLYLQAGRNLTVTEGSAFKSFGSRWNIVGSAGNNLTVNAAEVATAQGSIHLHAGNDLEVRDGANAFARVQTALTGGDISLNAGRDVIAPGPFDRISDGISLPGVHVGLPGNLTVRAGNDVRGPAGTRNPRGFGFTAQGGTADVAAGRDIGTEQAPVNLVLGGRIDNGDGTFTVPPVTANLSANRSLYFGLAEDFGLREFGYLTASGSTALNLRARTGDILMQPGKPTGAFDAFRRILPANFSAEADEGSILLVTGTTPLSFWSSPTGAIRFAAGKEIKGQGAIQPLVINDSVLIFVGIPGNPGTRWVRIMKDQALADPELKPWFERYGDLSFIGSPTDPPVGFPFGLTGFPPEGLRMKPTELGRPLVPAVLALNKGDVRSLIGKDVTEAELKQALDRPSATIDPTVSPVSFTTKTEDISALQLNFLSPSFLKQVTLDSGRDIKGLNADISIPVLPNGEPAVRIVAKGSIDLNRAPGVSASALRFHGVGTAQMRANGNIDLGNSAGIIHQNVQGTSQERNSRKQGGLLDIGAGGNVEMTQSLLGTFNGGSIFIHGADGVRLADASGRPITGAVETTALLIDQSGQSVLALPSQNGTPVPIEAFRTKLVVDGGTLAQARFTAQDVHNGQVELVWKPLYVEQTGQLLLVGGERVKQGDTFIFNQKIVSVDLAPAKGADGKAVLADGKPALVDGLLVMNVGGQSVSIVTPVGGKVNVGGSSSNKSESTGITTQRGGNITILATGNVDVNRSRIGTFDTGNVLIKSTNGTINAGSGSKDERTLFVIDNTPEPSTLAVVPGSGIFTWERDDPDFSTLPFPEFNTPQMNALFARITKRRFLGRDAAELEAEFARLSELRTIEFDQVFEDFIQAPFGPGSRPLQLGDISLIAARNIDVPQAGIRGRRINLEAGESLNLLGGSIIGKTTFSAASVTGSLGSFAGAAAGSVGGASVSAAGGAGGSSVGGLSGATSTVSATASSTSSTSATATKAVEQVQQATNDAAGNSSTGQNKQVAAKDDDKKKSTTVAQSVKMKHGVIIQVDVKPKAGG